MQSALVSIVTHTHTIWPHSYHRHHKYTGSHIKCTHTQTHSGQLSDVGLCISLLPVLKWVIYPSTASLQPARANTIFCSLCLSRWRERERMRDTVCSKWNSSLSLYIHPSPFSLVPLSLNLSSISIPITIYRVFFPSKSHSVSLFLFHLPLSKHQNG